MNSETYKLATSRRDGWACERILEGDLDHSDVRPYVEHLEHGTPLPPVPVRSIAHWYGDSL